LRGLYGYLPENTVNPDAEYLDQTDIFRLQRAAAVAGKKRIILCVFDGMDWQTTRNASIYRTGKVAYDEGRGTGLHFQDYRGAPTDFGYMVTSPHNEGTKIDVDSQSVLNPNGTMRGGYDWRRAGDKPWSLATDPEYLISRSRELGQAYTDSSSSATSMTAGIKTYNGAVNVDFQGQQIETLAHKLQKEGYSVGAVSSVPISHATPAAAYAHNVDRDDFQDLARDMVGLRSVAHRDVPLSGMDVVLGTGWGEIVNDKVKEQGANFVPGNLYLPEEDIQAIDVENGGRYRVVQRTAGIEGRAALKAAADDAVARKLRLFGFFGASKPCHLPFRTADGDYRPTDGARRKADHYTPDDLKENPTLSDMAVAALDVLSQNPKGFWLMVEAGDVDWANHDNNLDNSIGAVISGDEAVRAITNWIETHGGWDDTLLIVTADHGHYFHLTKPEAIATAAEQSRQQPK
jgi:alkaline phosphatase